jgi:hypothetical protein
MPTSKDSFLSRMANEYIIEPYKRMRDKSEKELRAEQYMGTTQEEMDEMRKEYEAVKKRNQAPVPPASGMKKGGKVSSASKRADGCAQRGKTRGRMV